jgi:hypothetical protein
VRDCEYASFAYIITVLRGNSTTAYHNLQGSKTRFTRNPRPTYELRFLLVPSLQGSACCYRYFFPSPRPFSYSDRRQRSVPLLIVTLLILSQFTIGEVLEMAIDWKRFETVFRLLAAVHAALGEDAVSPEISISKRASSTTNLYARFQNLKGSAG